MTYRFATRSDCALLAEWNEQLIQDEGHRAKRTRAELRARMEEWLEGDYQAILFEESGMDAGYALYRTEPNEIYLRQLFVVREKRGKGFGREAVRLLREEIWPNDRRLTVEVLVSNRGAWKFWQAVGYKDYSVLLEILPEKPGAAGR